MVVGRTDQYEVTIFLEGVKLGVFDTHKGGAIDSQEVKYRPGGMGNQVSLGGPTSVDNITVSRGFDRARDVDLVRFAISKAGNGRVTTVKQPLDADKNAQGDPFVYGGVLKKFTPSDIDSKTSDVDMYDIEVSTDGTIS